jgi:hypothetical protein
LGRRAGIDRAGWDHHWVIDIMTITGLSLILAAIIMLIVAVSQSL